MNRRFDELKSGAKHVHFRFALGSFAKGYFMVAYLIVLFKGAYDKFQIKRPWRGGNVDSLKDALLKEL